MKNISIQSIPLDPYCLPLYGQRLIESSAGTGKTYTIALLYLRLLLGIGKSNAFYRPLNVEEILVVTFSKSATNELRLRIRNNIYQMRIACMRNGVGFNSNSIYYTLLTFISDKHVSAQRLLSAERRIDEAAIYTIHSFCQHILAHHAFEAGILFEQSIIQDEERLQKQCCADFWRHNFYPLNASILQIIVKEWHNPDELLIDIQPYLQGDLPIFVNKTKEDQSIQDRHNTMINTIKIVKNLWILNSEKFFDLINKSAINKRSYSRRNVLSWLKSITDWAKEDTIDYTIPKELARFSQSELVSKTITFNIPKHEVFLDIDNFLKQSFTLRDLIISKAIINIRKTIIKEKKRRGEIGLDDLLSYLDKALQSEYGEQLANKIRNCYPVVMGDEFQDTDPQQYRIFQRIYQGHNDCCLLFIGDPKQAIYAFRGADVFTYLTAKNQIASHYTLDINWRSSPNMVAAVNKLFNLTKKPFVFEKISFHSASPSDVNKNLYFMHQKTKVPALNVYYLDKEIVSTAHYQQALSYQCASEIYNWIKGGENGETWLYRNNIKKPVTAADIIVLVRSHREAVMIQESLSKFNISSVFLSNKENVFTTNEANDLLWLLQSILSPEKKCIMRSALATSLIGLRAQDIENFNKDEAQWERRVTEFSNYLLMWKQHGIFSTLRAIMVHNKIAENLLINNIDGERRLINMMHISELLQEAESQLDSQQALVHWLEKQIKQPNTLLENHQIRLENDKNLVSISTIHKSKGLEYPLVWFPFACKFSKKKFTTFHNRDNFQICIDLTQQKENIQLSNEEHLSEELRLLYVALTRSVYHCSVGIAPLKKGSHNIENCNTDLHHSALGYLLQNGKQGNATLLRDSLNALANENIGIIPINNINLPSVHLKEKNSITLLARKFISHTHSTWKVTSYSRLQYNNIQSLYDQLTTPNINAEITLQSLTTEVDTDANSNICYANSTIANKSVHDFPRGSTSGTFLHALLERLPFHKHPKESWLSTRLEQAGFSSDWTTMLKTWLINIFNAPLLRDSCSLSNITPDYQVREMPFYLLIEKCLSPSELDKITHQYDILSKCCPPLSFKPVIGVLNGYIDLIFCWKNKFYILDYKSNWLGETDISYSQKVIQSTIIDHRYDVQYQLYALALHRYLKNRLQNYNYHKHFGGIIYFFLRGIHTNKFGYGIYHIIPSYEFINRLHELFSANN